MTVISELNTMPLFEALELLEASNATYIVEDGIIKYVCKEN